MSWQCGIYRTGTLWAHSTLTVDCHPDIVTMAKPLANGYPIGAVMLRDAIASTMTAGKGLFVTAKMILYLHTCFSKVLTAPLLVDHPWPVPSVIMC